VGLSGVSGIRLAIRWPHSWQGIVASSCDLLLLDFPRISRLDALMKACAILAIVVVMITTMLVAMTATRSLERGLFAYPVSRISIQCHKM
jgi:hypothetical protein